MLGQLDTFIAFVVVILGISLLITVLNHIITTVLGLRGSNLRWGIETLLQQVDARLAPHARRIADAVLQHPLISDSTMSKSQSWPVVGRVLGRWRLASAVKMGELTQILRKLAVPIPPGGPTTWAHLLTQTLADQDSQAAARLAAANAAIASLAPHVADRLEALAPQVAIQVRQAVGDMELWFDSVMDRVSQRFAARVRVCTVVFSVLVAFILHLDAAILLDQVRSDPELRAKLVSSADEINRQAGLVLGTGVASIYRAAAARVQSETPELKAAGEPPALVSEPDGSAWVSTHMTAATDARRREVLDRYQALVRDELKNLTGRLGEQAGSIKQQLEGAGLQLIPNYAAHTRKSDRWPDWWIYTEPDPAGHESWNRHFFGVLASAVLLSLGAPFWFNVLKTATTLKPIVATKETEDRAERT